jgi:uncharacterized RDD family membrane protein YckC
MQCPKCKLENLASAQRCDCGYEFVTRQVKQPYAATSGVLASNAEQVASTYDRNIVGQRWAAVILDIGVHLLTLVVLSPALKAEDPWGDVALLAWGLSIPIYFVFMEGKWGATLGKFGTKIRVVDRAGRPPGYGRALVRMLLRLVEVNPLLLGGIPAAIVALSSKAKQRVGDMLAGTYVLYLADVERLRSTQTTAR